MDVSGLLLKLLLNQNKYYSNQMREIKRLAASEGPTLQEKSDVLGSMKSLWVTAEVARLDPKAAQKRKLSNILVKTKKEKLVDLFVLKLKRSLQTGEPIETRNKIQSKKLNRFLVRSLDIPEIIVHFLLLISVIVVLILLWMTILEQFNKNSESDIDASLIQTFKIICLVVNVFTFFLKCLSRSFRTDINQIYITGVVTSYMKHKRFFVDLITIIFQIITLILPRSIAVSAVFSLFLIISLFYAVSDLIKIQTAYLHSEKAVLIWGLVKICFANLILAHIVAGILLAMSWIDPADNWLIKAGIDQEIWHVKYFYALYWATTIMMTVGFGDVLPANEGQVIFTTFIEMFSCILLGYNLSRIGQLVSKLHQNDEIVKKKLAILDRMVKSRAFMDCETKQELNKQINLYKNIYSHIQQLNSSESNLDYQRRREFLMELPENLRIACLHQNNRRIFLKTPFFNQLKKSTREKLSQTFQSQFFYEGELMLLEMKQQKIMILEHGDIGLTYKKIGSTQNEKSFARLVVKKREQPVLLTTSFLSIFKKTNFAFMAKNKSIVWSIDMDDFISVLKEGMIDFQYYYTQFHKHAIDVDQWNSVKCQICKTAKINAYHFIYDCPKATYMPLKQIIAMKSASINNSRVCERKKVRFRKNTYPKISVLKYQKIFSKVSEQLKKDNLKSIPLTENESDTNGNQQLDTVFLQKGNYQLPTSIRNEILELIQIGMRKYETGLEDGFWDLEIDSVQNYQFYFPKDNASRLQNVDVHKRDVKIVSVVNHYLKKKFLDELVSL